MLRITITTAAMAILAACASETTQMTQAEADHADKMRTDVSYHAEHTRREGQRKTDQFIKSCTKAWQDDGFTRPAALRQCNLLLCIADTRKLTGHRPLIVSGDLGGGISIGADLLGPVGGSPFAERACEAAGTPRG